MPSGSEPARHGREEDKFLLPQHLIKDADGAAYRWPPPIRLHRTNINNLLALSMYNAPQHATQIGSLPRPTMTPFVELSIRALMARHAQCIPSFTPAAIPAAEGLEPALPALFVD